MRQTDQNELPSLLDFHKYCLAYRNKVRSGETPTEEENRKFMAYQKICYQTGIWKVKING